MGKIMKNFFAMTLLPVKAVAFMFQDKDVLSKYTQYIFKKREQEGIHFYSYIKRPQKSGQVVSIENTNSILKKTAIIMQGPLVGEHDFTIETVKIYHKIFPGASVIVSTWENENQDIIQELKKMENCNVVLNGYPEHSGILNLNYQVVSTMQGIKKAKELGKQYVWKTRSDFRFMKKESINYFYCLLQNYPVDQSVSYQKYRIITGNGNTNSMFRAFWLADQYSFGHINDMYNFWNYSMDMEDTGRKEIFAELKRKHMNWKERIENRMCAECNIVRDYLSRMEGNLPDCTVKNFWETVRKQFIVVGRDELEAYWFKYESRYDETARAGIYYEEDDEKKLQCYNWNFQRWLMLYMDVLEYKTDYETIPENIRY